MTVTPEELAGFLSTQDPFTQDHPQQCVPLATKLLEVYTVQPKPSGEALMRAELFIDGYADTHPWWNWRLLLPSGRVVAEGPEPRTSKSDAMADLLAVTRRDVRVEILYELTPDDDDPTDTQPMPSDVVS